MAYERQINEHLDRFDQSLASLHTMVKRGQNKEALRFMEEGKLKERFEELQSIIRISNTNQLGASGVSNTRSI